MPEARNLKPLESQLRMRGSQSGAASLYSPALRVRTLGAIDAARIRRERRQLALLIGPASLAVFGLFVVLPAWLVTAVLEWLGLTPGLALTLALLLTHTAGIAAGACLAIPLLHRYQQLHSHQGAERS